MTDRTQMDGGDVNDLADAYLESLQQDIDEERREELGELIAEREERREELKQEHGADHYLVKKAHKAIEQLRSERTEIQDSTAEIEERRQDLLEAIVENPGFEFDEQWLKPQVLRATTHALYGVEDTSFAIQNREIEKQEDVSDLDEFDQLEMAHIIVSLARDRLEGNGTVRSRWERLSESVAFPAIKVLAEHGSMAPREVASELDEDSNRIKDRLKNFFKWDEFIPVYRPETGVYALSTTGEYLVRNYTKIDGTAIDGSDDLAEESDTESTPSVDAEIDESDGTQATIGNSNETDFSESEGDDSESDQEPDTESQGTKERAQQMFADIGDGRGADE